MAPGCFYPNSSRKKSKVDNQTGKNMHINIRHNFFTIPLWIWFFLGMTIGCPGMATANIKTDDLKQKVADMALLHHQLSDRVEEARIIREKFRHQKQSLLDEINLLQQTHKYKQFTEADQHLRIHYNLMLIGTIDAYLERIEKKIIFYENGQNRLDYLQKLASDDIRMISTLNDLEIDALTTQISLVISQYLAEAHAIQLQTSDLDAVAPEKIWASIITPSN
jgi:hypothetical protein